MNYKKDACKQQTTIDGCSLLWYHAHEGVELAPSNQLAKLPFPQVPLSVKTIESSFTSQTLQKIKQQTRQSHRYKLHFCKIDITLVPVAIP